MKVLYKHSIRDWLLVRDPHGSRRVYWKDSVAKVRRFTPPLFVKEIGCQTGEGLFLPDQPADPDVWSLLRDSVALLTPEQQFMVYSRIARFIDLGWHDMRARRI